MKKNDYFIDVSSYQSADLTVICQQAGTKNTIIKVSEGTTYLSPNRVTQAQTSNPIGYYHFARFGGNSTTAVSEANFFIANLPTKTKYLVCDYEDSAGNSVQGNTNAVLAFMDTCASAGYKPIYYSYKPYTLANIDYKQILAKYPNSLWIAAYPNYNVTPDPVWSVYPSMDGIRWWQFTSTGIAGGLDKNVVLIDDDSDVTTDTTKRKGILKMEELLHVKDNIDKVFVKDAIFLMNYARGTYQHLNGEELAYVKESYKRRYGEDIKQVETAKSAPVHLRLITAYSMKQV